MNREAILKTAKLTDGEIQYIITHGLLKYAHLGIPKRRQAIDRDIAKAAQEKLLNLCYPCPECGGTGNMKRHDSRGLPSLCGECAGSGLSSNKALAILSEEQKLPEEWTELKDERTIISHHYMNGYRMSQHDMTTPKDGKVWKKVLEVKE